MKWNKKLQVAQEYMTWEWLTYWATEKQTDRLRDWQYLSDRVEIWLISSKLVSKKIALHVYNGVQLYMYVTFCQDISKIWYKENKPATLDSRPKWKFS